jgi:hypothetical protein
VRENWIIAQNVTTEHRESEAATHSRMAEQIGSDAGQNTARLSEFWDKSRQTPNAIGANEDIII